jgi:hypothetical protein
MADSLKGKDRAVVYRFGTDGFCIRKAGQQGKASYDSIVDLAENGETFAEFIEGRTGLQMKHHRRKKTLLF